MPDLDTALSRHGPVRIQKFENESRFLVAQPMEEQLHDLRRFAEPVFIRGVLKRREQGFEQMHVGIVAADARRLFSESAGAGVIEEPRDRLVTLPQSIDCAAIAGQAEIPRHEQQKEAVIVNARTAIERRQAKTLLRGAGEFLLFRKDDRQMRPAIAET